MRFGALLAILAALAAGCGSTPRSGIEVPKLVGMQKRHVEELLASKHLRWKYGDEKMIHSEAPPANTATSSDDDRVVKQSPRPGTVVGRGRVIRLVTGCMVGPPCA